MNKVEKLKGNIDRKHALLDLKIEEIMSDESSIIGMKRIKLYKLVKEKARMLRKYEA